MAEEKRIPNMLFSGSAGTGKTSSAIAIVSAIGSDNEALYINASESTGIDTLRNDISKYAHTVSFSGERKVVILDEVDRASGPFQDGLKSFLEEFSKNVSFIFISNHKNRIIPPLVSRVQGFDFSFSDSDKKEIAAKLKKSISDILEAEHAQFEMSAVSKIVKTYFPDLRKILNELQRLSAQPNGITESALKNTGMVDMDEYFKGLASRDYNVIKRIVCGNNLNFSDFYTEIFAKLESFVAVESLSAAILILAQYSYQNQFVADPRITMLACSVELMSQCKYKAI
jgi:replication factor C small subunit